MELGELDEPPTVMIFGASGRIGSVLAARAQQAGYHCLLPSHAHVPLEDQAALTTYILAHPEVSAVVNCAGMSSLEACVDDPYLAHQINAMAPATMALICRHTGAKMIHLSSDYVLDGRRVGLKDERAKRRALSVYAESKNEGEWQLREANEDALICRVSWVCGNVDHPSFIEQICHKALVGEELYAVDDQYSLPTHVDDIARVCLACIGREECKGVIHLCSKDEHALSRYDCAEIALEIMLQQGYLTTKPNMGKLHLDEVRMFRDIRPRNTAMSSAQLVHQWGMSMPSARACIEAAVSRFCRAFRERLNGA